MSFFPGEHAEEQIDNESLLFLRCAGPPSVTPAEANFSQFQGKYEDEKQAGRREGRNYEIKVLMVFSCPQ